MVRLQDIQNNEDIKALIEGANKNLEVLGYTEHGIRHVTRVSETAARILRELGYPNRLVELAAIAGLMHDIGNCINRKNHGIAGANLLFPILLKMKMPMEDIVCILSAIGSHEEQYGSPVNEISAALIIADKIDAHRTRIRKNIAYDPENIHNRVNYSIKKNWLEIDKERRNLRYEMIMDMNLSCPMDFLEIYSTRMRMCEDAAEFLDCSFELVINNFTLNRPKYRR